MIKRTFVITLMVMILAVAAATQVSAKPTAPQLPDKISMWWLESLGFECIGGGIAGYVCTKGGDMYRCTNAGMCVKVKIVNLPLGKKPPLPPPDKVK